MKSNDGWKKRGEVGSSFRVNDRWLYIIYTWLAIQLELPTNRENDCFITHRTMSEWFFYCG